MTRDPSKSIPETLLNKTIVWSDDDATMLEAMRLFLKDCGVNNVHCVRDPEETIRLVRDVKPDLLITDMLKGPGKMDGHAMVKALRMDPSAANIPVLLVTAAPWTFDPELFTACVALPCKPAQVLEAVRGLLS